MHADFTDVDPNVVVPHPSETLSIRQSGGLCRALYPARVSGFQLLCFYFGDVVARTLTVSKPVFCTHGSSFLVATTRLLLQTAVALSQLYTLKLREASRGVYDMLYSHICTYIHTYIHT